MPQLDFSYYLSQICWLCINFCLFFLISKFLILPNLKKIVSNREKFILSNIQEAENFMNKSKKLISDYNNAIVSEKKKVDENFAIFLNECRQTNEKEINDLKVRLALESNKEILKLKQEIQNMSDILTASMCDIVCEILQNVYSIKVNRDVVEKICEKKFLITSL